MKLPGIPDSVKPGTFAEGQRALFGCLVSCAGIAHFVFAATVVSVFVWGGWPEDLYADIIGWLGYGLLLLLAIDGMVVISLSLGGPVGRLKMKASKDGFEGEASGDGEPAAVVVQQTTTVSKPSDLSPVPLDDDGQPK